VKYDGETASVSDGPRQKIVTVTTHDDPSQALTEVKTALGIVSQGKAFAKQDTSSKFTPEELLSEYVGGGVF